MVDYNGYLSVESFSSILDANGTIDRGEPTMARGEYIMARGESHKDTRMVEIYLVLERKVAGWSLSIIVLVLLKPDTHDAGQHPQKSVDGPFFAS